MSAAGTFRCRRRQAFGAAGDSTSSGRLAAAGTFSLPRSSHCRLGHDGRAPARAGTARIRMSKRRSNLPAWAGAARHSRCSDRRTGRRRSAFLRASASRNADRCCAIGRSWQLPDIRRRWARSRQLVRRLKRVNSCLESRADIGGDRCKGVIVNRLHGGDGIDRRHLRHPIPLLNNHVAGQHGSDLVLRL